MTQKITYTQPQTHSAGNSYKKKIKALALLFQELHEKSDSVTEQLQAVVTYHETFCKKSYDDYPKRMKDLETFVDISGSCRWVAALVEEMALDPIEATAIDTEPGKKEEDPVSLST